MAIREHKEVAKTYYRIRERFFWPGIKEDLSEYVRAYERCHRKKLARVRTTKPKIITTTPSKAIEILKMLIVSPLP